MILQRTRLAAIALYLAKRVPSATQHDGTRCEQKGTYAPPHQPS